MFGTHDVPVLSWWTLARTRELARRALEHLRRFRRKRVLAGLFVAAHVLGFATSINALMARASYLTAPVQ